jgi:hypothetical protein
MNSASKIKKLARPLGAALLNLWVSSLIPPGVMLAMKAGTVSIAHSVMIGACLLIPASSRVVPAMHATHVRRALVPLATVLEAPEPAADLPLRIVRVEE